MVSEKSITIQAKPGGTATGGTIEVVETSGDVIRYYKKMQKDSGAKIISGITTAAGSVVGGVLAGPPGMAVGSFVGLGIGSILNKLTGR